jgi:hypothetical protein
VYPPKENLLCIASVAGSVKVIDAKRGKIVSRIHLTSSTIFETDWNVNGIVACSENCSIYFLKYAMDKESEQNDLSLFKVLNFECPIRTVQWNSLNTSMLAAGTFTGFIFIIDGKTFE